MKKHKFAYPVPELQSDAVLTQAAPVQNTWYTILDTTKNARIHSIAFIVADTDETLELKITADDLTSTITKASTADTYYMLTRYPHLANFYPASATHYTAALLFEARSVKIEIRKTSAAGVGTITGRVKYGKW